VFASDECKKRIRRTLKKRYGVEHALQYDGFRQKARETTLERFGVQNAMNDPEICHRQQESMMRNWGVRFPMQLQHVREAMMSGSIAKYGVPYAMQDPEYARSMIIRRAEAGTLYQSKSEDAFYHALCEKFGEQDVQRQVPMNHGHWVIDFYIRSLDTYVQFDGVYWHGLDRPIETIKESAQAGHRRDLGIYRKWLVDRQQEKWFAENGLRLVRVNDRDAGTDPRACLLMICHGTALLNQTRDRLYQ
jgi:very-short-patch-repair endonuclease